MEDDKDPSWKSSVALASILSDDGYAVALEDVRSETPVLLKDGTMVVLMSGLIYGTPRELEAQIDHVFARLRAHGRRGTAFILCDRASFRFPEPTLRHAFHYLKGEGRDMDRIHFVNMPLATRIGFKLALHFLDPSFQSILQITTLRRTHDMFENICPRELGGEWDFDRQSYVAAMAATLAVPAEGLVARAFDSRVLAVAHAALLEEYRTQCARGNSLESRAAEKRGGGGLFGSRRWNKKRVAIDAGAFVYFDPGGARFVAIPLQDVVSVRVDGVHLTLVSTSREFFFRFAEDETPRVVAGEINHARRTHLPPDPCSVQPFPGSPSQPPEHVPLSPSSVEK